MLLNVKEFREQIVRPTLSAIQLWSQAAENLLIGTALTESNLEHLVQDGGPALGLFQIEPFTYNDICRRIKYRPQLFKSILDYTSLRDLPQDPRQLIGNIILSVIICRMKYYFDSQPLPDATDINSLGAYYKRVYNSALGDGSVDMFVRLYEQYGN